MPIVTIVPTPHAAMVYLLGFPHGFSPMVFVSPGHTVEVLPVVWEALDEIVWGFLVLW
jgi:hypothetical protein